MMKTFACTVILSVMTLLSAAQATSTWKETRTVLFPSDQPTKTIVLQPGQSVTKNFTMQSGTIPTRKFLRVIGGVKLPGIFQLRGETMFRASEYLIDDNLNTEYTINDKYSLYFKGENNNFEREAYYRIPGNLLKSGELTVTLPVVRKKDLKIDDKGNFGLKIGLYFDKEGRAPLDIYDDPDSIWVLPVSEGTMKREQLIRTFSLPDHVSCLFLQLGGTFFSGECWVEAPRFKQGQKEVISIPFTKFDERPDSINYWVGSNLSTRSWPKWKLSSKGVTLFEGNVFDRASNVADFYIALPSTTQSGDEFTLTLVEELHRQNFPYEVRGLEIIEETARSFEVVSVPRYVTKNAPFGLLIETNQPQMSIKVSANQGVSPLVQECRFEEPGLHVIEFRAKNPGDSVKFIFQGQSYADNISGKEIASQRHVSISSDGLDTSSTKSDVRIETACIKQIIDKAPERIYLSSGDEIYIDKVRTPYNYFFKWYMANRIGNWYQFRPSYQWSGFRVADTEVIGYYTRLLNEMQIPYAWQVEGRTLAGSRINPSTSDLFSPMFRGKQAHENDGGYYYWKHFKYEGLFSDMAARARPLGGIFAKHRPIYTDHGTFIHYDHSGVTNMEEGARTFVSNLQYSKGESTRHTGPSTMFRYFYQAGYEWLGAEQMYGPEETILSTLRGASRAYHRNDFGTLHAMQWGSFPFTDPKHALRLYMSLAVAYMHGSSHMNTEEALWTDERMNDRYSESGKAHLFAQHQMLDFIETHTRRGQLTSRMAVIQGRYDAWKSFVRGNLWSQEGHQWKFDKANESFDLLKVFYPGNILDACDPEGWFTSTPYGTVDILPIEASLETMNRYKAIMFLGWNTFDSADFERIRNYVFQGGTLMLSAAHLNAELKPNTDTKFPEDDEKIRELLGDDYRRFTHKTEIHLGAGRIIYFPQPAYPAESTLREDYTTSMKEIASVAIATEIEKGWIEDAPSVGFTVWDEADRRTIYLLNTDWKSNTDIQPATFVYGDSTFKINVRRYHVETIHCANGLAVLPNSNTTDILSITEDKEGWTVKVQSTEADNLQCMNATNGTITQLHTSGAGIFNLKISFIQE